MSATQAHHGHVHNAELNRDPTRTTGIRNSFEAEAFRRFRRLKGLIRTTIVDNDAFRLRANAEPADIFDFPTDPAKEAAFMEWLQQATEDEVIAPVGSFGVRDGRHWTGKYVRASYARAVQSAGAALRAEGFDVDTQDVETLFNLPVHQSAIQRIYQRAFENLEGVTDAMARQIREELTTGFVEGVNPREMARRVNDRVDKIGITRARTLARTETIHAHTEGTLTRFEREGVEQVTISAEWATAGDLRVCPICVSIEGEVFTTTQARTETFTFDESEFPLRPPAHPNCRCALLPVVS